jgi:hypothetical protein
MKKILTGFFIFISIHVAAQQKANGVNALKDVSLVLENGMFGLLGPNGLACGHPETPTRGWTKTRVPATPGLAFYFIPSLKQAWLVHKIKDPFGF